MTTPPTMCRTFALLLLSLFFVSTASGQDTYPTNRDSKRRGFKDQLLELRRKVSKGFAREPQQTTRDSMERQHSNRNGSFVDLRTANRNLEASNPGGNYPVRQAQVQQPLRDQATTQSTEVGSPTGNNAVLSLNAPNESRHFSTMESNHLQSAQPESIASQSGTLQQRYDTPQGGNSSQFTESLRGNAFDGRADQVSSRQQVLQAQNQAFQNQQQYQPQQNQLYSPEVFNAGSNMSVQTQSGVQYAPNPNMQPQSHFPSGAMQPRLSRHDWASKQPTATERAIRLGQENEQLKLKLESMNKHLERLQNQLQAKLDEEAKVRSTIENANTLLEQAYGENQRLKQKVLDLEDLARQKALETEKTFREIKADLTKMLMNQVLNEQK